MIKTLSKFDKVMILDLIVSEDLAYRDKKFSDSKVFFDRYENNDTYKIFLMEDVSLEDHDKEFGDDVKYFKYLVNKIKVLLKLKEGNTIAYNYPISQIINQLNHIFMKYVSEVTLKEILFDILDSPYLTTMYIALNRNIEPKNISIELLEGTELIWVSLVEDGDISFNDKINESGIIKKLLCENLFRSTPRNKALELYDVVRNLKNSSTDMDKLVKSIPEDLAVSDYKFREDTPELVKNFITILEVITKMNNDKVERLLLDIIFFWDGNNYSANSNNIDNLLGSSGYLKDPNNYNESDIKYLSNIFDYLISLDIDKADTLIDLFGAGSDIRLNLSKDSKSKIIKYNS